MTEWNLPETYDFKGRIVRYGVKGEGPPVVVVHGTPWSSFNLRHIIKALSQSFTVYYYDLIGYGQSDKTPGDFSLGIQNQLLDHLLDHWRLENPAIVGHDFGGTTLLRTLLINKRDFDKMVLIDPVAVSPRQPLLVCRITFMKQSFAPTSKQRHSNPSMTAHSTGLSFRGQKPAEKKRSTGRSHRPIQAIQMKFSPCTLRYPHLFSFSGERRIHGFQRKKERPCTT